MSVDSKTNLTVVVDEKRGSPETASVLTARSPRITRFAEAVTTDERKHGFHGSPIVTNGPSAATEPAPYSSGIYTGNIKHTSVVMPMTPMTPGMRTATSLKVPGTPGKFLDPRSPTFREELAVEKEEQKATKQNAKDLKVKIRIRIAKFFLRGVNFSCSLIVLSMISTSLTIFETTKSLPPRDNLPPWAEGQQTWPQILLLCFSCVSLAIAVVVFWSYWKGGHRKAAKTSTYYTMFSIAFFIFSTVMWVVGAVVFQQARANGNGQDLWGWSCNQNRRAGLFDQDVNYALVCRLQNWSLVCALIEVVIEVISIAIYIVVFYRFRSKQKLMRSMDGRDKARNDLYLAQLKLQSAPNTPGYGLHTGKGAMKSAVAPTFGTISEEGDIEQGVSIDERDLEYQRRYEAAFGQRGLAPPPAIAVTGATPNMEQGEFAPPPPPQQQQRETVREHFAPVAGEETYEAVPIPGAYAGAKQH